MERFNDLLFSDNIYKPQHVSQISDDIAYVVYKNIFNKPNPKGNIFIAAFTTAYARLHLYEAVRNLDRRVLYMDTDSVVFDHFPGMWTPKLSNYLGDWTDEVAPGLRITDFVTGGPKNYSYVTQNLDIGSIKTVMKVKGLRLTKQAADLLDADSMRKQLDIFADRKHSIDHEDCVPAKRRCLVKLQKKETDEHTKQLNETFLLRGAQACVTDVTACMIVQGPCNCSTCCIKTSLTIPQAQFRKHRRDGFVETAAIRKEYQLVLRKRWLLREYHGRKLPFGHLTFPFGFVKL
jgi:hypothetical protein